MVGAKEVDVTFGLIVLASSVMGPERPYDMNLRGTNASGGSSREAGKLF